MHTWDDADLLAAYATQRSEAAFAALLERHLPLVYSSDLRQMHGDIELVAGSAVGAKYLWSPAKKDFPAPSGAASSAHGQLE